MSHAARPEPVYLKNMPREVAKRADELYGKVDAGSLTIHKGDDGKVKYEIRAFMDQDWESA